MEITAKQAKRLANKLKTPKPPAVEEQMMQILHTIEKQALYGKTSTKFVPFLLPETKNWLILNGYEVEIGADNQAIVSWENAPI